MKGGYFRPPGGSPLGFSVILVATLLALPLLVILGYVLVPAGEVWQHLAATVLQDYVLNSLLLMVGAVVAMMFINGSVGFFIVGAVAGFAMAGVQSVSRTMVSIFAPAGKSAEFYGFFALAGRTSSVVGPGVMGLAATGISAWVLKTLADANLVIAENPLAIEITEQIGHRFAIITIIIFLVVGLMLLLFVSEDEGRRAALAAEKEEAAQAGVS